MKKFLVSTADVMGYDESGNLVFVGKTLLDSSIETTLANTDVRGGRGNQLQYFYYHTAEMSIKVSDAQWNLDLLSKNVGSDVKTGNNVYKEETVTLAAGGAGTVTGTPLASFGTSLYGWVTLTSGVVEKVTFTGSAFTCAGSEGDEVTVRYYLADSASRSLTIRADMVPSILYLVMEAQLCSSEVATNKIGIVQIVVPNASMTGAFSIAMTPDGVASTPLSVRAFSKQINGVPVYATITEILDNANWYDNVIGLAIVGGDFALSAGATTHQLEVRAIPNSGSAFKPPYADLTFASSTEAAATVSAGGLVTRVAGGMTTVKVTISAKTAIDANVVVTVS